jgi:hypothetical protein
MTIELKMPIDMTRLHNKANEVVEFLVLLLEEGPRRQKQIVAYGLAHGFTKWQLRTAREKLGVIVTRTGFGRGAAWTWDLPRDRYGSPRCYDR